MHIRTYVSPFVTTVPNHTYVFSYTVYFSVPHGQYYVFQNILNRIQCANHRKIFLKCKCVMIYVNIVKRMWKYSVFHVWFGPISSHILKRCLMSMTGSQQQQYVLCTYALMHLMYMNMYNWIWFCVHIYVRRCKYLLDACIHHTCWWIWICRTDLMHTTNVSGA